MPFEVDYEILVPYRSLPGLGVQPALEVRLHLGGRDVRAPGILDSGAVYTVFGRETANLLGIEHVEDGDPVTTTTMGGPVTLYQFDVEIEFAVGQFSSRFPGRVCFSAGHLSRNLLGRVLFFPHFQIGFRDRRQEVYLAREME